MSDGLYRIKGFGVHRPQSFFLGSQYSVVVGQGLFVISSGGDDFGQGIHRPESFRVFLSEGILHTGNGFNR